MQRAQGIARIIVLCGLLGGTSRAEVRDHLECYRVQDPLKLVAVVDLNTRLGLDAGCRVSAAELFCASATKTVQSAKVRGKAIHQLPVSGSDPGDRICYKVRCPNSAPPAADQQESDQFGTRTLTRSRVSLLCTPAVSGPYQRFVDNGDGTITDRVTGLQWEQKTDDGSLHDKDNMYSWSLELGQTAPTGTLFTRFLPALNDCVSSDGATMTGGFANHCDWRVPTIVELQTILDTTRGTCGGGSGACIDPVFGPTVASLYWSNTTDAAFANGAWAVYFDISSSGNLSHGDKGAFEQVRAVRSAVLDPRP